MEVKRLTEQSLTTLPPDDEGRQLLVEGGGSQIHMTLAKTRGMEHDNEEIHIRQDGNMTVCAVLHRPLRAVRPWTFGLRGVCPAAYDESEGGCVLHQLTAVLQKQLNLGGGGRKTWVGSSM